MCRNFVKFGLMLSLVILTNFNYGGCLVIEQQQFNITTTPTPLNETGNSPPPAPSSPGRISVQPTRVKLNKCCQFGEYLDASSLTCVAGSSDLWVPKIYLTRLKDFYKLTGRAPNFMTFVPNVRPIKEPANSADEESCTAEELELFTGGANIVILSDGSLYLAEHMSSIPAERYCVDRDTALVCWPKQMQRSLKIHKCCEKFRSYDAAAQTCSMEGPNIMGKLQLKTIADDAYQTLYGFPKCNGSGSLATYAVAGDWSDAKLNTDTGMLQLERKNFTSRDYCLEHLRVGNGTSEQVKVFACLHHYKETAHHEAPANATIATRASMGGDLGGGGDNLQTAVLNFGILVSVVFLAATLVASYLMPSVHHVLHWRCQIYYVFCLFVGESMLAYTQLGLDLKSWGSLPCLSLASLMHFFFLSAFFWLNTMCFNIWWTFRDFRPSSLERNQELLRLRLYSAYAWGIPLIICSLAVLMDQLPYDDLLKPNFGVRNCWFSGEDLSIFAYFYGPMGVLLCANIVLFISTTHQLTCGLWKRDDVKSTTEKTALGKVCLKLVVVMGVTWIADILSWVVGGPHSVWFFTDLVNALQGVFIFIVVGCQPQVWAACKRFCCPRSRQEITNTTNGVQHSSSSQGLPSLAACGPELTQNTSINTTLGGGAGGPVSAADMSTVTTKVPMETEC